VKATHALWLLSVASQSCVTAGSNWIDQPLSTGAWGDEPPPTAKAPAPDPQGLPPGRVEARVIAEESAQDDGFVSPTPTGSLGGLAPSLNSRAPGGRVLGTFRNTYYDFPSEADFIEPEGSARKNGEGVALKNPHCKTIKNVARAFYEAVCVQGSGTLASGGTVSFAKRDCECAAPCPRTEQRICFDELDAKAYPWGRGATGRAISPLLTVAVDSDLIPLDTPLYIPEYDGLPRDPSGRALHDGCFIAQDRGVRVKGEHVDIFTGQRETTLLWNRLVPTNRGVTVVLDSPHCARVRASR
jgi:3D (Asp-Asp-Asp) domain-containing protein